MKMLIQFEAASDAAPFVLADVKTHIRVTEGDDDAAIENMARTAAAEIERFCQIVLLAHTIRVTVFDPFPQAGLALPIGPVSDDVVPTVTVDGVALTGFEIVSGIRPYLRWPDAFHDLTPRRIVIEYEAGFGTTASDIPHDLAQAIMDQAALHFDGRSPMDAKSLTTSPHMARIGARYRGVQV